jgi:hypothetical protein
MRCVNRVSGGNHENMQTPTEGAGDRTRTGTPSLAVDFERRGFSRIRGDSEALKGTIHLAKRIKTMQFHRKNLHFPQLSRLSNSFQTL